VKIAITADLHLTTKEDRPERYQSLADILQQCGTNNVGVLIIAGDLFDTTIKNFADFEIVYKKNAPEGLKTYIIQGNHDSRLVDSAITLDQVTVVEQPCIKQFDDAFSFLLIPYSENKAIGEQIAPYKSKLEPNQWVLISHCDWIGGVKPPDPYEQGVYMPLSRADVLNYAPYQIFLGHIHVPSDSEIVHYVGSPCPIKHTETGHRRFVIFDTETKEIESCIVNCPSINFIESFVVLPVDDEIGYLKASIKQRIEGWGILSDSEQKIKVRIALKGYTSNRSKISQVVEEEFHNYDFIDEGPLINELNQIVDPERANLVIAIKQWLDELQWGSLETEPGKDEIMIEVLKTIYED
jgi:DNA repair exonuclease SbcCD nuclease subunit